MVFEFQALVNNILYEDFGFTSTQCIVICFDTETHLNN